MLLQLSVTQFLNDSVFDILIRICMLESSFVVIFFSAIHMSNLKKTSNLFQKNLESASTCVTIDIETSDHLKLTTNDDDNENRDEIIDLLQDMQKFFDDLNNCDENFLFAHHKQTIVSIYIDASFDKRSMKSTFQVLTERLQIIDAILDRIVAQRCDNKTSAKVILSIFIDITSDLATMQKTILK